MTKIEKKPYIDWKITMPFLLLIALQIYGMVWNTSSMAKNVENQIMMVNEKLRDNREKIKKNADLIESQAKLANKISIDTATLRVQSVHIQRQVSKIEDILKALLIEARK